MSDADDKIIQALRKIVQAQSLLYQACEDLSPVVGMAKEWELIGKEAVRVKTMWHKVNARFESNEEWKLDD